jgi:hypothetical protein
VDEQADRGRALIAQIDVVLVGQAADRSSRHAAQQRAAADASACGRAGQGTRAGTNTGTAQGPLAARITTGGKKENARGHKPQCSESVCKHTDISCNYLSIPTPAAPRSSLKTGPDVRLSQDGLCLFLEKIMTRIREVKTNFTATKQSAALFVFMIKAKGGKRD